LALEHLNVNLKALTDKQRVSIQWLSLPSLPQRSIAHYRITSKLGEGGMGAPM
jgi:hypothetical protein